MCGIAGFLDFTCRSNTNILKQMTDTLVHRGPDGSGYEIFKTDQTIIGLGHRRLSIIDLSPHGKQPMASPSGRYILSYNGEIYNFQDIRTELENLGQAPNWRGHSDTEVLLAAIECWGLTKALQKSVGMFALALWDKKEQALFLARDRMGEKPLYYGWQGNTFLFGSELKALKSHPVWAGEVDREALCLYMRHGYIPAPYSVYQGIKKLTQGTLLRIDSHKSSNQGLFPKPFWSLRDTVLSGMQNPFQGDEREAVDELERLLLDAVGKQMVSDVPLGAFLSGGYDSSLITALMQAQSTRSVKTFSIGFHEQGYNEAPHAKAVAEHLGTNHTEMYVTPQQGMDIIPSLPQLYDEPFADSSQVPTCLLAKMTRDHVTVALSGDGGDELMRGYARYDQALQLWRGMERIPRKIRSAIGKNVKNAPAFLLDSLLFWSKPLLDRYVVYGQISDKIFKACDAFIQPDFYAFYKHLVSLWNEPENLVVNGHEPQTCFDSIGQDFLFKNSELGMIYLDSLTYLPDDILVKVDRAAMGVSLETRIPFLDHRVVEFIWSLPTNFRWRAGTSKWALREVLYRYIPKEIMDRPKQGFAVPIDSWLRGPIKGWADHILSREKMQKHGLFNSEIIEHTWKQHLSGNYQRQNRLWSVLMATHI